MSTPADHFTANTAALNALVDAANAILSGPIDASKLKGIELDLAGLSDGDVIALKFDQANNKFTASKLGIDENFAVDLSDAQDGYTLRYVAAENKFVAVSPLIGGSNNSTNYAPIQKIKVVPGDLVSFLSGINKIYESSPLIPAQSGDSPQVIKGLWWVDREPWKVFDQNSFTRWNYYDTSKNDINNDAKIGFDFGVPTTVGGYSIQCPVYKSPISWVFAGSDDGVAWTTLQIVNGEPAWNAFETRFYELTTPVSYQSFRLSFSDAYRDGGIHYNFNISELQFFPTNSPTDKIQEIEGSVVFSRTSKVFGLERYNSKVFAVAGFAEDSDKIFAIDTSNKTLVGDIELATNNYDIVLKKSVSPGQFEFEVIIAEYSGQIAISSSTGIAYVSVDDKIFAYNLVSGNLVATIETGAGGLRGMAISSNKLYACSSGNDRIVIVDLLSNAIDRTLAGAEGVGLAPWEAALHSGQGNLYVTFKDSNQVGVFDIVTDSAITTISVGAKPTGIVVSETLDRAVVVNSAGGIVSIISTTSNSVIASVPVGVSAKPSAAAIDAANNKAFVACEGYHQVAVINLVDNTLESRISVEPEPVDLVWVEETKELYCSSQNGTLTIIALT